MIKGDAGMESIYTWSEHTKRESFRGASGGGDGVHVLTGPIAVDGAEPGDVLKVEIVDLRPRANPEGKTYGSNANAWWGFQARVPKADGSSYDAGAFTSTPGSNDEVITIYELASDDAGTYATPSYAFKWPTLTDPEGVERDYIKYPGTCVPHDVHGDTTPTSAVADMGWTKASAVEYMDDVFKARVPVNMHVGCMGLAPASHAAVDSIPPMPSGGNLDDKRIGVGTTMYYPVEVAGALLSMGDAHTRAETIDAASAPDSPVACRAGAHGAGRLGARRHGHRDLDHGRLQDHADQGRRPRAVAAGPGLSHGGDGQSLDRPLVHGDRLPRDLRGEPRRHLRRVEHRRRGEEHVYACMEINQ
jgi:hypothetical protein